MSLNFSNLGLAWSAHQSACSNYLGDLTEIGLMDTEGIRRCLPQAETLLGTNHIDLRIEAPPCLEAISVPRCTGFERLLAIRNSRCFRIYEGWCSSAPSFHRVHAL